MINNSNFFFFLLIVKGEADGKDELLIVFGKDRLFSRLNCNRDTLMMFVIR